MKEPVVAFDWQRIFLHDFPGLYLLEVALRTFIMFLVILLALRVSGKREVKQLSVYELVLVIGLGSAAGDPMFYDDVPLLVVIVVFVVMMSCYKLATRISDKNKKIRVALEGKPVYVIENGCIDKQNFDEEDLGLDELFAELRLSGVEQLGQVRVAILEPHGELSVFLQEDKDVKPGLPILPKLLNQTFEDIQEAGLYACRNCGNVTKLEPQPHACCKRCDHNCWVKAQGQS
ncbi:DUF421 domain-containing protein [Tellurirhabdus bombi]|uniref:DUF421 domain-containing protein n=1 Tax=Tellurirhabdus bombi TaxID=2907205 RepID=UPI001F25C4A6|nr:YetF domain-containing protein [Tellurirhabdus bombi]